MTKPSWFLVFFFALYAIEEPYHILPPSRFTFPTVSLQNITNHQM